MRSVSVVVVVVALSGALLAACGGEDKPAASTGGGSAAQRTVTVKVAAGPFAAYAPLYVGIRQGIFAKHHLKVDPQPVVGGAEAVAGLISGSFQFGSPDSVATLTAASKGLPLRVLGLASQGGDTANDDYSCLEVRDKSITTPKQLEGKTVAVNVLGNIVTLSMKAALAKQNVDVSKIKYLEIPVPEEPQALQQGRVDAVSVTEPFCRAMEADGARSLSATFADTTPRMLTGVWVTTQKYIDEHGDVARNFAAAIAEANAYSESHPEVVREVVPTFTQIPAAVAKEMKLPSWSAKLDPSSVALLDTLARRFDMYKKPVDTKALVPDFVAGGAGQ
jgi:NitT/TauT family transport system substrate-binding protein